MKQDLKAFSRILGTGFYVPPRVVTNDELSTMMDTSDEWIRQRTGIRERHYSDSEDPPAAMGAKAARMAIADADLEVEDIDTIIVSTLSPDYTFPGTSVFVQERLGLAGVACMDIRNQCTGLLYALATADAYVRAGLSKRCLVVGTEVHSTALDFSDAGRDVTVLFGDGAAALVLVPTEDPARGFLAHKLHADGRGARNLWLPYPSSAHFPFRAPPEELYDKGGVYPIMNGRQVFKHACKKLPQVIAEVLTEAECSIDEVDVMVPHQANLRINELVAKAIKIDPDKVVHNIQRYGNTTSASIGIALHEARMDGRIQDGSLVLLAAFGSGFTWAASLLRF